MKNRERRKPLRRINQNVPGHLYDRLAETTLRENRTKSAILVRAFETYIRVSEQTDQEHENHGIESSLERVSTNPEFQAGF